MMLVEVLDKKLLEDNYKKITSNIEDINVYYKPDEIQTRIIHLINLHGNHFLTISQYENLQRQVRQLFLDKGYSYFDILTIIVTEDTAYARQLTENDFSSWIIDKKNNRVLVYEDRPIDFYGLRKEIDSILNDNSSGGRSRRTNLANKAVCNTLIIITNVLIFFILELGGSTTDTNYMLNKGVMIGAYVFQTKEYYRFITCMFLHFGIEHLLNNMVVLFFLGDNLERAVGKIRYCVIYLLSGIGGTLISLAVEYRNNRLIASAGASGAIFGIMGALLFVVIANKGRLESMTTRKLVLLIGISLYHGFTSIGVDNMAHLGGMVSGFLLAALLYRKDLSIVR